MTRKTKMPLSGNSMASKNGLYLVSENHDHSYTRKNKLSPLVRRGNSIGRRYE